MGFRTVKKPREVYKAAFARGRRSYVLVTLRLPKGAVYHQGECHNSGDSIHDRKCRANRAKVVSIETLTSDGAVLGRSRRKKIAYSGWSKSFAYPLGKTVKPLRPFSRQAMICASGIHFFHSKQDALNFRLHI